MGTECNRRWKYWVLAYDSGSPHPSYALLLRAVLRIMIPTVEGYEGINPTPHERS